MDKKDLKFLREIGIEKIKQDTKLDTARISDILEKRFERLDYVRAKGFIAILEREYNLDLSDWLEEYRLSILPQKQDEVSLEHDHQDDMKARFYEKFCTKKILILGGMIGICLIIVFFIVLGRDFVEDEVEDVAQTTLDLNQNDEITQQAESQDLKKQEAVQIVQKKSEDSASVPVQSGIDPDTPINELGATLFEDVEISDSNVLTLTFDHPIWVGVIDLDSKRKVANTQAEYQIPLDQERLFYIAYGKFVAKIEDTEEKFRGYDPVFLIYTKDGGLRKLTKAEYLFVNGGVEW